MLLGVNIDHIATLRNARGENDPSVIAGAMTCELSGADGITVHLREDRRHIKDDDLVMLKKTLRLPLNLEMALNQDVLEKALEVKPRMATLVPEKREEITTEGGLDINSNMEKTAEYTKKLQEAGIIVSLFIEADINLENALKYIKPEYIEIHTGYYSNHYYDEKIRQDELKKYRDFIKLCKSLDIKVNAGHGLNYNNLREICQLDGIMELNIGHSIISRAVFSGLPDAIKEMNKIIKRG